MVGALVGNRKRQDWRSVVGGAADKDLAFAYVIGRADDAFLLHLLDQLGRPVVPDCEMTLDEARACLSFARDQGDSVIK